MEKAFKPGKRSRQLTVAQGHSTIDSNWANVHKYLIELARVVKAIAKVATKTCKVDVDMALFE